MNYLPNCNFVIFLNKQHKLASKRGYPSVEYSVLTPDGYILGVHRILSSPLRHHLSTEKKKVVFLQHGVLESSATWVMSGAEYGFGK